MSVMSIPGLLREARGVVRVSISKLQASLPYQRLAFCVSSMPWPKGQKSLCLKQPSMK